MADTQSQLLQLVLQADGNNDTTWGDIANAAFTKLENAIAGSTGLGLSGGTVTLTTDQARSSTLVLTGAGDTTFIVPSTGKIWVVTNAGTGSGFFQTAGNAAVRVPPGRTCLLVTDGTTVRVTASGSPVGSIALFAMNIVPSDYLLCDGSAISRTTYVELYGTLGLAWGVGDGSTTFNIPDFRGRMPLGLDNMNGSTAGRVTIGSGLPAIYMGASNGSEYVQNHAHNAIDPGHFHVDARPSGTSGTPGLLDGQNASSSGAVNTQIATTGISIAPYGSGNSQNMPPFAAVNIAIKVW